MFDRRHALKLLAAAGAGLGIVSVIDRFGRPARADTHTRGRPRFYLQIIPSGGMDAVYTTDPKTTREVTPGIDIPFPSSKIVESAGLRLGPPFRALARWLPRLAVVNMFRQNSANHQSGLSHITRCKSHTTAEMPTLLDILGTRRHGDALGSVSLGADFSTALSPMYLGEPGTYFYGDAPGLLEHLDREDPDDLRAAARVFAAQAEALGHHRLSARERATADNLLATSSLFERAAAAPKFKPQSWKHELESEFHNAKDVQRAIWLFENQLARCVTVSVGSMAFDTHELNDRQVGMTSYLASLLDHLFTELDARQLDGRPLSEQIVVVIGSEIGRFPRLNGAAGKDHFPQAPYILFGLPFKSGSVYGGTDRDMVSLPVSVATGRPERGGHLLQIDDLGTTLMHLDGANPELYGFTGTRLTFLEA